jgi:predicted kinase
MGEFLGRLAIMCGLPKSGKTTSAKTLQQDGWVRLCPDEVRLVLHGQSFLSAAEPLVWANVELMARALLHGEHKVLIDATNTTAKRRKQWLDLAKSYGIVLEAFVMDTPVEECRARNDFLWKYGSGGVPDEVIDRMAEQWEPVEEEGIEVTRIGSQE